MRSRAAFAITVAFIVIATLAVARCAKDVPLGVAPASDAAADAIDGGAD